MVNLPPFQQLLDAHGVDLHRFCVAQAGPDHGPTASRRRCWRRCGPTRALRDDRNLRGWLFTIAHHKVLDHHRAVARRAGARR